MRVGNIALRMLRTTSKSGLVGFNLVFTFLLQKSSTKPNSGTVRFGSAVNLNLRGCHFSMALFCFSVGCHNATYVI